MYSYVKLQLHQMDILTSLKLDIKFPFVLKYYTAYVP